MSVLAFDTHRTVKRLIEAGFSSDQAETVTDVLRETRASDLAELATKADLRDVQADLRALQAELRTVETNVTADLRSLQADLRSAEATLRSEIRAVEANTSAKIADGNRATLQWVVGMLLAQTAVMAGLIKLLAGH
jgi:capsule polysaccharide export protein KpsE/RkpR